MIFCRQVFWNLTTALWASTPETLNRNRAIARVFKATQYGYYHVRFWTFLACLLFRTNDRISRGIANKGTAKDDENVNALHSEIFLLSCFHQVQWPQFLSIQCFIKFNGLSFCLFIWRYLLSERGVYKLFITFSNTQQIILRVPKNKTKTGNLFQIKSQLLLRQDTPKRVAPSSSKIHVSKLVIKPLKLFLLLEDLTGSLSDGSAGIIFFPLWRHQLCLFARANTAN